MTFATSSAFILPFGKYKGQSIGAVAETNEGLRYLDWLGIMADHQREPLRRAVATFLANEVVACRVRNAVEMLDNGLE